ncbi:hypothetical protein E4U40_000808 [Claviceps sp. LM458 group G5]|nr:hypothetical protein E4U40_000808 [Claviceps sp. LM458 group G5]
MYRTQSEGGELGRGGSTSKTWWKLRRRNSSKLLDIRPTIRGASLPRDSNINDHNLRPLVSSENQEVNLKQLLHLIQRMRPASSSASNVDSAYKEFDKHKETCANLCAGILEEGRASRLVGTADPTAPRDPSIDSLKISGGTNLDEITSYSGGSMSEPVNDGVNSRKGLVSEVYLNAMRDWRGCLETLCDAFRSSLADTYKSYERYATPEMLDLLFTSKKFRRDAVHRMRNASVTRMLSADPQFFPRYEIRFRNYERVKRELIEARQLLQSAESGILPTRQVQEFIMSPQGDAMLEFANHATGPSPRVDPVLRFRVSSRALADTSPIFARMFSGRSSSLHVHEAEDIQPCLPPSPTPYMCEDGTEAQLYRMPQYEINRLQSFEVLMHAAHMHTELVPNTVSFERFVAIAECSLRYKSTAPLERVVQESWLPQWLHRGTDMPDGLLVISYAFGIRELFTRMSKRMILSLVDEKDLQTRPWPQKIRDKIWAVRCAKLDQIYACCTGIILEYLPRPTHQANISAESDHQPPSNTATTTSPTMTATTPLFTLPSRCPRGSHGCDAANLGWLLLNFNEMHLLPHILQPSLLSHSRSHTSPKPPPRSLAHTIDISRKMPSPVVSPMHHSGICDPSLAFRAAIDDIHSSIHGLTLHDISGKSHGWALSKDRIGDPQIVPTMGLRRMAAGDERPCAVVATEFEFPDAVRVRILAQVDDLGDLRALARMNRAFFETYKRWEVWLVRRFLQRGVQGGGGGGGGGDDDVRPCRGGRMEMEQKVRRGEVGLMREAGRGFGDGVSVISFLTNDGDEGGEEEEEQEEEEEEEEDEEYEDENEDVDNQLDRAAGPAGSETPKLSSPIPDFQPQDMELPEHPDEERQHSSSGTASPPSLRHYPSNDDGPPSVYVPRKSPGPSTIHLEEAPMTNEEARRILWPDLDIPDSLGPVRLIAPGNERQREKFLASDLILLHTSRGGLEDKTLVGGEDRDGHLLGEIGLRAGARAIRPAGRGGRL